ncbi:MAG: RnfABCDGE type electron transport complex subunit A, partial [Clostridia bacterium]|nr:RnfABCDGE type electron transport complex subunit A [Clostridia bacterium]
MNKVTAITSILLAGILTNNMVLSKFLGICPFLGVSKKVKTALSMSVAVTLVMVIATAVTWPIDTYVLKEDYNYLQTVVFILVIAAIVQLIEIVLKKYIPPIYKALGIYLPLITTNCAVLGITLINVRDGLDFVSSLFNALAAGLGFMLAMILFAGVREKLETADIPEFLKGLPITLIAAA